MQRREFLKKTTLYSTLLLNGLMCKKSGAKPNVLFIAIDDLNDWIKPLNPESPVQTPNLDNLFKRGVLFTNAFCSAPACNPSRVAVMTGLRPSTTGVYGNQSDWRKALPDTITIPQHFMNHGYQAMGAGKIYHHQWNGAFHDEASFNDFQMISDPPDGPMPEPKLNGISKWIGGVRDGQIIGSNSLFDWGPYPEHEEEAVDYRTADYAVNKLAKKHPYPWFLAVGFFRPHMPFFAPKKYFDMYPLDQIKLPMLKRNDVDDIPAGGHHLLKLGKPFIFQTIIENDKYKEAIQAYYAGVTFMDAQLGRVIEALDKSPDRNNTIIVLWSDHGYHLGEKEHWEKFVLWRKTTRMPFFISAPGVSLSSVVCERPVSLLDIYPTLNSLCGLTQKSELEGVDITSLLKNPRAKWNKPVVSTYLPNNHAVSSQRYHYIHYADGTEELYDYQTDPGEWTNLAGKKKYFSVIDEHKKWLPKVNVSQVDDMKKPL